jgi:hypothetical protein
MTEAIAAISPSPKNPVSQAGTIAEGVTYTPGDGAPIGIPPGPVEVTLAFDSATLSWDAGDGVGGLAAMPTIQFDDYVSKGLITLTAPQIPGN